MKRSVLVLLAVLATLLTWAPAASAETRTVSYGPFTIPAGTMDDPGMINNKLQFAVKRPCSDCYITRFTPDLIDAKTGQSTNMDDGPMLHHAVWTSQWRSDATCGGTWLGLAGQRFFASGNERSVVDFPYGYGYRVRWYDSWNMLVDLMNHSTSAKTVYVRLTVETRPSWASVQSVRPVWLDIDQCGDSEYDIPDIADTGGFSDKHRDWTVNVPGKVVSAVGHVHGHGVAVEATNESALPPYSICRSEATPGMDAHEIASMSTCVGAPSLGTIKSGETVRLHSQYSATHPLEDVMGIMLMYVRPQ